MTASPEIHVAVKLNLKELGLLDVLAPLWSPAIGSRMRKVRKQKKLSQGEVSHTFGLSQGYLSKLESGAATSCPVPIMKFLQVFGEATTAEILLGHPEK